eukprot:gb/GECG01014015.1/.p1 GENE.gb/GECG01014015.1/~~gb/GECG01014015.1/.p1  ORF type:complete len:658 (+),score=72.15 gb/GECG01014015.1/:1-1974(+)
MGDSTRSTQGRKATESNPAVAKKPSEGVTYAAQDSLPSLPVPPLEQTMNKLIRSCQPFLTESELEHTKACAKDFQNGIGQDLQQQLEERAASMRNWVEDWWETFAYLRGRDPSAINVNWHGCLPGTWGPESVTQSQAAAIMTHHILKFRDDLISERLEPEKMSGQPLDMHQYSRMFNSCRIPQQEQDEIVTYKDEELRDISVLCNDKIYLVEVIDSDGQPLSYQELALQFERVLQAATPTFDISDTPPLSVLTSESRDRWATAREHLMNYHEENARNLEAIERSLFCVSLRQGNPRDLEETARECLHGDGRNIFFDKPFNLIIYPNSKGGVNGEHSWADAMVIVKLFDTVTRAIEEEFRKIGRPEFYSYFGSPEDFIAHRPDLNLGKLRPPRELVWHLDTVSLQNIELASANMDLLMRQVDLKVLEFSHYGKEFMKRYRLIPDFYIQMAIQLAYFRLHGEVASTYESGHTRFFYHGRTETIRSCSVESTEWVNLMTNDKASDKERFDALKKAIESHKNYGKDAILGQGIDRHLMGLYIVSEMNGIRPVPSLFTDKGFNVSKEYKLSTSNISMQSSPMFGGFFTIHEDGYGVCYSIRKDRVKFSITANTKGPSTDATKMKQALSDSLIDMQKLCLTRNVIYVTSSEGTAPPKSGDAKL